MRFIPLPPFLALVLFACGCSGKNVKSEGEDPTEFAKATKQSVLNFVRSSNENPKATVGNAEQLLERLEVHPSRPVGDNKPVYEQLTEKCKEIIASAKKSPNSPDVKQKLEEMQTLANKLPD